MSYLTKEQNKRFLGTGAANGAGLGLQDFLDKYDPKRYDLPANTVDMAIFKSDGPWESPEQPLKLLMIKRSNHPSIGWWALPGGFVELRENLEDAAARELEEETGVKGLPLVQLRTWGDYDRDPRMRIITTAYMALVEGPLAAEAGDDAADAKWFDIKLNRLDHSGSDGVIEDVYELKMVCDEGPEKLSIGAKLKRMELGSGLLRQVKYSLESSDLIASDHALIIADALLTLKGRLI